MNRAIRIVVAGLVVAGLIMAGRAAPAAAQAARAAAEVRVHAGGSVGRLHSAVAVVDERCRAGAVVQELVVTVTQGAVSGTVAGVLGARCDGTWHTVEVTVFSSTGDRFTPGHVTVAALFTVLDPVTMDPFPQGRDSADVTLLPAVEAMFGQEGRIARFGGAIVPVLYRCQRPWVATELVVDVSQGAVGGTGVIDAGLHCDARWHHVDVGVSSGSGAPFTRGDADVDLSLTIEDPVEFDPVDQARTSTALWLSPAARITVSTAVLAADGTATVTVSARCQRPWVVQEWTVELTQQDGRVGGLTATSTGLTCDAKWHRLVAHVTGNVAYVRGPAVVNAVLTVLDPVDFDPVDQDSDRRSLQLHR